MVDTHLLLAFVVTTAVAMIVPGPDMLFILGCGIRGGPRAGLLATCGVATSETIHVALAAAGLTALFVAVPTAFTVVRIAGAAYWIQFAILGSILVVFEFLVDGTVGVLAGRIGSTLRRRRAVRRGLDVAAGGIFIGLGVRLAAER